MNGCLALFAATGALFALRPPPRGPLTHCKSPHKGIMTHRNQQWNFQRAGKRLLIELERSAAELFRTHGLIRAQVSSDKVAVSPAAQDVLLHGLKSTTLRLVEIIAGWKLIRHEMASPQRGDEATLSSAKSATSPAELMMRISGVDVFKYLLGSMEGLGSSATASEGISVTANPFLTTQPPSLRLKTYVDNALTTSSHVASSATAASLSVQPRARRLATDGDCSNACSLWSEAALALMSGCTHDLAPEGHGADSTLALVLHALGEKMQQQRGELWSAAHFPATLQGRARAAETLLLAHAALLEGDALTLQALGVCGVGALSAACFFVDVPAAGEQASQQRSQPTPAPSVLSYKPSSYKRSPYSHVGLICLAVPASKPPSAVRADASHDAGAAVLAEHKGRPSLGGVAHSSFAKAVGVYGHGVVPEPQRRHPGAPHLFSALEFMKRVRRAVRAASNRVVHFIRVLLPPAGSPRVALPPCRGSADRERPRR